MRRYLFLLLALVLLVGCDPLPPKELKYQIGDTVQYKDSKRVGIILRRYETPSSWDYIVSYEDNMGQRHEDAVKEFQLEGTK